MTPTQTGAWFVSTLTMSRAAAAARGVAPASVGDPESMPGRVRRVARSCRTLLRSTGFVADLVAAYAQVTGSWQQFDFLQMRARLRPPSRG
jgi:hypothetical protein